MLPGRLQSRIGRDDRVNFEVIIRKRSQTTETIESYPRNHHFYSSNRGEIQKLKFAPRMRNMWKKIVPSIKFWTWCCVFVEHLYLVRSQNRENKQIASHEVRFLVKTLHHVWLVCETSAILVFEAIETIIWKPPIMPVVLLIPKFLKRLGRSGRSGRSYGNQAAD